MTPPEAASPMLVQSKWLQMQVWLHELEILESYDESTESPYECTDSPSHSTTLTVSGQANAEPPERQRSFNFALHQQSKLANGPQGYLPLNRSLELPGKRRYSTWLSSLSWSTRSLVSSPNVSFII